MLWRFASQQYMSKQTCLTLCDTNTRPDVKLRSTTITLRMFVVWNVVHCVYVVYECVLHTDRACASLIDGRTSLGGLQYYADWSVSCQWGCLNCSVGGCINCLVRRVKNNIQVTLVTLLLYSVSSSWICHSSLPDFEILHVYASHVSINIPDWLDRIPISSITHLVPPSLPSHIQKRPEN